MSNIIAAVIGAISDISHDLVIPLILIQIADRLKLRWGSRDDYLALLYHR